MANRALELSQEESLRSRVRQLEAALARSQAELDDLLDVSLDWMWETDAGLRFTRFAGRIEQMLGIPADRLIGRTREQLALDPDDPRLRHNIAEMQARRPFRNFVYPMRTSKGMRWVKTSGKPVFDAAGNFTGYRGSAIDATAEVEAEHRAETIYRRFAEAIESVPASLLLCDPEDRIVICNSATQRYFPKATHLLVPGTPFEDLVRAQVESRVLPEAIGHEDEWVADRMRRHRSAESTIIREHSDGSWVQIIERRTSEGGIIGIRVDITEIKQRERQVAEYSHELERSNAELEQFAYVASHDLQEPLRMVASYCQLLQRRYQSKLDRDADDFIGYAVEGANRMQHLISDLLTYSRVGRRGGSFVAVAAGDVVRAVLADLHGAIAESGARIAAAELPTVSGDPTQLHQLFQNLIGNSIKFRRDEPPVVRIAAEPDGRMWLFSVEDNGIGIEPAYAERVFLIFQRLHDRAKYPGTGIGLAIVKKVVEHHGGRIWIEPAAGGGTRFNFTLPAAMPEAA